MSIGPLAPELLLVVFEQLIDRKAPYASYNTLSSCALVHTTWTPLAQSTLFRHVVLPHTELQPFFDNLLSKSALETSLNVSSPHVDSLTRSIRSINCPMELTTTVQILELCPMITDLRGLVLHGSTLNHQLLLPLWGPSLQKARLATLSIGFVSAPLEEMLAFIGVWKTTLRYLRVDILGEKDVDEELRFAQTGGTEIHDAENKKDGQRRLREVAEEFLTGFKLRSFQWRWHPKLDIQLEYFSWVPNLLSGSVGTLEAFVISKFPVSDADNISQALQRHCKTLKIVGLYSHPAALSAAVVSTLIAIDELYLWGNVPRSFVDTLHDGLVSSTKTLNIVWLDGSSFNSWTNDEYRTLLTALATQSSFSFAFVLPEVLSSPFRQDQPSETFLTHDARTQGPSGRVAVVGEVDLGFVPRQAGARWYQLGTVQTYINVEMKPVQRVESSIESNRAKHD